MSEGEVRQPIGFLRLEDGPIQLDPNNLDLVPQNYGIDVLRDEPIIGCVSETMDGGEERDLAELYKYHMEYLTHIVVRHLEHHRIPGRIVLYYELRRLGWDVRIACMAYRKGV
jgi:hypothetical protein